MNNSNENWKEIPNTLGQYMVSDQGRIKSVKSKTRREKILRASKDGQVNLSTYDDEVGKMILKFSVHRLVAEAFVDNPDDHHFVVFIDGDKTNRAASNLKWVPSAIVFNKERAHSLSEEQIEAARRIMEDRSDEGYCAAEVMAYLKLPFNKSTAVKLFGPNGPLEREAYALLDRREMIHGKGDTKYTLDFDCLTKESFLEDGNEKDKEKVRRLAIFNDHYNNSLS